MPKVTCPFTYHSHQFSIWHYHLAWCHPAIAWSDSAG